MSKARSECADSAIRCRRSRWRANRSGSTTRPRPSCAATKVGLDTVLSYEPGRPVGVIALRIGIIEQSGRRRPALAIGEDALDVTRIAQKDPNPNAQLLAHATGLESILRAGPREINWLDRVNAEATSYEAYRVRDPVWRAPLTEPSKICAIGLNYLDHCREQNVEPPKVPRLFAKYPSAIIGPGEDIVVDPELSEKVDYEAELAVVIGKKARHVRRDRALEYVFGYMNANDVTARDLQKSDEQFTRSKSLDTFCPLGPWIATRDEVRDPHRLRIQSRLNGRIRQDSNTSNLVFGVDQLISFLSQAFTLMPGDIILTGTPSGVGAHRDPPEFLRDDDRIEIEIEGLGLLENKVRRRA